MDIVRSIDMFASKFGIRVTKKDFEIRHCSDYLKRIVQSCSSETMTDPLAVVGLCEALEYVVANKVEGSVVECGVWRGGSAMAAALILKELNDYREIYLYDTYSGMTPPTSIDVRIRDSKSANDMEPEYKNWKASLEVVRQNMNSTGYPESNLHFVVGSVMDTLKSVTPSKISVLRLDTDWFESTYSCLQHLYPALQVGGVLIVDDYNYFSGARKAVQQYFQENNIRMLFSRIGSICVIGVKM